MILWGTQKTVSILFVLGVLHLVAFEKETHVGQVRE